MIDREARGKRDQRPRARHVAGMPVTVGNAEDDGQRLEILKRLSGRADLDPQLRGQVERTAALVDRWLHDRSLCGWFDRDIRSKQDYDLQIGPESPLAPLARFYRGRMLVWAANEYGNVLGYHEERRKFFDRAVEDFRAARAAFPANRIAGMYLGANSGSNIHQLYYTSSLYNSHRICIVRKYYFCHNSFRFGRCFWL